jgi:hypothetical protein
MDRKISAIHKKVAAWNSSKTNSRKLWSEHVFYTRNVLISIISNLADVSSITTRLMKNQEDIGEFIRPYYYDEDVDQLITLLKEHITLAATFISGVGSSIVVEDQWRDNAAAITALMEEMNPYDWAAMDMQPLWTMHIDHIIAQNTARRSSNWAADIVAVDENYNTALEIADKFAAGANYYYCY